MEYTDYSDLLPTQPPEGAIEFCQQKGKLIGDLLIYEAAYIKNPLTEKNEKKLMLFSQNITNRRNLLKVKESLILKQINALSFRHLFFIARSFVKQYARGSENGKIMLSGLKKIKSNRRITMIDTNEYEAALFAMCRQRIIYLGCARGKSEEEVNIEAYRQMQMLLSEEDFSEAAQQLARAKMMTEVYG